MAELRKTLSTWQLSLYGIGTMLGAGIYVLVGEVAGYAGMFAPLAFLVAALLAGFTAFSYAELSAWFPKSGGEVVFVEEGYGKKWFAIMIGWLVMANGIISAGAIIQGFVGYLHIFIDFPDWLVLVIAVLLLGAIAIWGIGESMNVIGVITLIEIAGLVLVVVLSGESLGELPVRWPELIPPADLSVVPMVFSGAFLAFYAYVGFEDLANVAEEAKNPKKSLPKAVLLTMGIGTFLYILVALVGVLSLGPEKLAASDAPLAKILEARGPQYPFIIAAISLVAVVNGVLAQIVMGARVMYGMAEKGLAPKFLAFIHPKTQTPWWTTIIVTLVIMVLALAFPIKSLAEFSSFVILFVFTVVNGALILIRRGREHPTDSVSFPGFVPVLGFILSAGFFMYKLISVIFGWFG